MNVLSSGLNVFCRRKGFLNAILEQTAVSLNILPCATQVRFKSKRNKELKEPKVEEQTFRFSKKKKEEEEVSQEIYSTPSTDDVWIKKYYPTPTYSFLDAINMHRELASPDMTSNTHGSIVLTADLDLRTKKKTKFLGPPEGLLLLPHNFDNFFPGRVVALTKCEEEQQRAKDAGAVYSGGIELIRKIEKGDIKAEDFDHVVLSNNLLVEAAVLKKVLKDLFPLRKNGNLGDDVERMAKLFTYGKEYQGVKISDAVGKISLPIGKMDMTNDQLLENVKAVLADIIEQVSSSRVSTYFAKLFVTCPPSKEVFIVKDESIMPVVLEVKKKSKKMIVEEDEGVEQLSAVAQ